MKLLYLTAVLGTANAALGPHLLGGAAEYHRGLAEADVSLPDLVAPFAGRPTIAVRVHHDNDDKTQEGVAEAVVAALRQDGLPPDPAEAAALVDSTVPLSIRSPRTHRGSSTHCFRGKEVPPRGIGGGRGPAAEERRLEEATIPDGYMPVVRSISIPHKNRGGGPIDTRA